MDVLSAHRDLESNAREVRTRLVVPRAETLTPPTPLALHAAGPRAAQPEHDKNTDPLVQALLDRLPKAGTIWSIEDRAEWLRTAASVFGLVYKASDGDQRG
jgi:hypothetical protein